jgi:hypothetical protein
MQSVRSLVKVLLRLTALAIVAAAVRGVLGLVRAPGSTEAPTSFDQWPDVPEKPVAD